MVEENVRQEFKSKNIDEARNYFIEEIKENEETSKKHKKVCTTVNYIELTCFRFCGCWMCFNICSCFFSCYSFIFPVLQ